MTEETPEDKLEPINTPTDVLIYSVQSLVGVRLGLKPLEQHFEEINIRWKRYTSQSDVNTNSAYLIDELKSYDYNSLYSRIARAASNYGLNMDRDDYDSHYSMAICHTIFVLLNPESPLNNLEEKITNNQTKEPYPLSKTKHRAYSIKNIIDMENRLMKYFFPFNYNSLSD